jgi:glycosyltransferase involved in cell wall biosynthesis
VTRFRVLFLVANRWWTGSADPTLVLARELRARGHEVSLGCVRGDRFEAKAREAGLDPRPELSMDPKSLVGMARDLVALGSILRTETFQILHVNHSHDHWLATLASRGLSVKIVRTFHAVRAVRKDPLHRWLYRTGCHAAVAVSRGIEARCHEAGISPARCVVLGGAVDLDRFSPEVDGPAIRAEFSLGTAPVVGTVSRLAPNRGHELLLRAFRGVIESIPEARLLIVGKGENRNRLEALVRALGLASAVVFTGYRDRDLPQALGAMDVFALMGTGSEESCRAALEAMAGGKPVVGRKVGALPETIRHGETGWLLDSDNTEELTGVLLMLLKDLERARRMGSSGRRLAESEHGQTALAERMEGVYCSVLTGPPGD